MRALIQRVLRGRVTVEGSEVGAIGPGLVVLVGAGQGDGEADARYVAEKIAHLRIFEDEQGKMNRSVSDVGGEVLVVSQFTLYGDCRKGRRPSFTQAAPPDEARRLVEAVVAELRKFGLTVATGQFQAHMVVEIINDGPVTLMVEGRGGES
ncbi:d-tyrosyl-tRNA(tyr) deacylase [Heliomicrobium modesticaldum Ice1]|uniref:D-aminoacyl-tRNA deacylase n=1 Tax=Heliobacterium modesticaldum (strain ATCC 51547 / Ice1) TaxID=498761 RepID=DTD_HELMI|nr:D-aminoacyl-tRNA deacylase [Heliomicrobium modesticaldum]B0TF85.1 RecName: Full=D-aminoacyl-tRNA deacylase; Short=DTD; AltName: Full=Gly-tRNA(Ala) deacylase [Heliomicrobium modesticaldum Ice1]ABZ84402.1 d-tyrosyl-tRNA(tyr) deacylase [Heliomicrobium modesticaldum Ice1]